MALVWHQLRFQCGSDEMNNNTLMYHLKQQCLYVHKRVLAMWWGHKSHTDVVGTCLSYKDKTKIPIK